MRKKRKRIIIKKRDKKVAIRERRRARRYPSKIKVAYGLKSATPTPGFESTSKNLSGSGISFPVDKAIKRGTRLDIWLHLPDGYPPILVSGKVAWTATSDPSLPESEQDAGIKLAKLDIPDKIRLYNYLYNLSLSLPEK